MKCKKLLISLLLSTTCIFSSKKKVNNKGFTGSGSASLEGSLSTTDLQSQINQLLPPAFLDALQSPIVN